MDVVHYSVDVVWSADGRVKKVLRLLPSLHKFGEFRVLGKTRLTCLGEVACTDYPFKVLLDMQVNHVQTHMILRVKDSTCMLRWEQKLQEI